MLFSPEVSRRVRLRSAVKFDLSELLGEPIIVHVGEMPQSQQSKLISYLSVQQELIDFTKTQKRDDETHEQAVARLGNYALTEEALVAAKQTSARLNMKLFGVMQELVGPALLDSSGDRLSAADQAAFFDLLPASKEAIELIQAMAVAALERTGKKKSPSSPSGAAEAAPPK